MADSTLTELQRVTVQMLDNWVMDPKILIQNCPLDHGRHEIKPKHDLGGLHVLPTELQQHVLCFVDIKTLLTFRSVSMSAMGVVDGIIEYQKVMKHAPHSLRMAIGIRTTHTFTIKQLFAKLCQKTCDEPGCGKFAAYLNVFTLSRRCLSVGGGCLFPRGPIGAGHFPVHQMKQEVIASLPSFYPISEQYSEYFSPQEIGHDMCRPLYNYFDMMVACCNEVGFDKVELDDLSWEITGYWKLCSVRMPWLSTLGAHAEHGVFCPICKHESRWGTHPHSLAKIKTVSGSYQGDDTWSCFDLDPGSLIFLTTAGLKDHMREKHADMETVTEDA